MQCFKNVESEKITSLKNPNKFAVLCKKIFRIRVFHTTCRRPLHSRIVFKNFKNQPQRSTLALEILNQSAFYNHHASRLSRKQFEILF